MPKKMLIDATHAEETRVVVVEGSKVDEFDFESLNKRQLAGNIYLAKITRVEPSLQAAFVDYGGNRHGFLAFSEIHPDYYQIPLEDRKKLLEEEAAYAAHRREEEEREEDRPKSRNRRRKKPTEAASDGAPSSEDAVVSQEVTASDVVEENASPEVNETVVAEVTTEDVVAEETASTDPAVEIDAVEVAKDDEAQPDDTAEVTTEASTDETSDESDSIEQKELQEEIARPRKPRVRRYKIQEVVKVRQIMLVQVVKEERGNKGAALTTYLSLAGRYCVLMPNTARGGGISRKITNVADRKKLKDIANTINVPDGAGLIIRTAGSKRTKTEINRDYEYLLRQWEQIRETTFKSIAPTHIYEEGSLIKRSIRDLYNKDIDEIIIDGERGFNEAKDYMNMLMPSHAQNVKLYREPMPLFSRFHVESYLSGMFNPTVQLKSGGYIVIGITEALVAIDVNSGRATKENSIEETARKTNLEAAEEVARQLRLRDLAGLIVIDFIDMDERRNNAAVEKKMKDKLKSDRARIQIGRISSFGLMEMSRQRLRPGMLEASTQPCPHCHGTGITRSNDSMSLAILRELEEEGVRGRTKEVLVSAPIQIANYMLNEKREHVAMIESRFGLSVRVEADAHLISPEYRVERFKVATRIIPEAEVLETSQIEYHVDTEEVKTPEVKTPEVETEEGAPKKRRRRRRRGGKSRSDDQNQNAENNDNVEGANGENKDLAKTEDTSFGEVIEVSNDSDSGIVEVPEAPSQDKPKGRSRTRRSRKPEAAKVEDVAPQVETKVEPQEPAPTPAPAPEVKAEVAPEVKSEPVPEVVVEAKPKAPKKPKRKGWWSL